MITESKVTENFCIADDFCKEFEIEMAKKSPRLHFNSLRNFQALLSRMRLSTPEVFIPEYFLIQPLCGADTTLFYRSRYVPKIGLLRKVFRHQFFDTVLSQTTREAAHCAFDDIPSTGMTHIPESNEMLS